MLLLDRGQELAGLHGVVGVADLHGVVGEGGLEQADGRLAADRRGHAARQARRAQRVDRAVLAHDRFVAPFDPPDAAGTGEHVFEVIELVLGERGDLAPLGGHLGALDEIATHSSRVISTEAPSPIRVVILLTLADTSCHLLLVPSALARVRRSRHSHLAGPGVSARKRVDAIPPRWITQRDAEQSVRGRRAPAGRAARAAAWSCAGAAREPPTDA